MPVGGGLPVGGVPDIGGGQAGNNPGGQPGRFRQNCQAPRAGEFSLSLP